MGRDLGSCFIWHVNYVWGRRSMGGNEEWILTDIQQYEKLLGLEHYYYSN